jgi:hypothetical protein
MVGCGDGDGDTTATAQAGPPPKGSPAAVAQKLLSVVESAKTNADCKPVRPIIVRSAQKIVCPPLPQLGVVTDFQIVGGAAYGTGAVVDYKTAKRPEGASMTMFRAPDGKWGVSRFGLLYEPSVGTSDESNREDYEKVVSAYLNAVRDRDCDAFIENAVTNPKARVPTCRGEFMRTMWLAKALRANPGATPRYLGGNEVFGFYGLQLDQPKPLNVTIDMVKTTKGAAVPFIVMGANRSAAGS